jgi:hypothetical protein
MGWITEDLIGAYDGNNKSFTVSSTPIVETMSVWHNGPRLSRVAGTPQSGEAQYGVSGVNVVLGTAPAASNEWVVTRYFTDS